MPINLGAALRLAAASNPTIGFAEARVRIMRARLDLASVLWLPDLSLGANYYRLDGQTQNQHGETFTVSRNTCSPGPSRPCASRRPTPCSPPWSHAG